jgi:8-oxo-dGTP pyrophosphatase MutT (NUDIX family)
MAARAQIPRQQIPRPAGALPGAPAPWSELAEDRRRAITVDEVRRALAAAGSPAPGSQAPGPPEPGPPEPGPHAPSSTPPWGEPPRPGSGPAGRPVTLAELPEAAGRGPAAVLCLLFELEGEANVVLTRRSAHLRAHSGEVSFPGGRLQPGERPIEAALREANEEIGIESGDVLVIGELTPLTTVRSPALVHCFVGHLRGPLTERLVFASNPSEVEKVFWVPLARLAGDGVYHEELWPALEGPELTQNRPSSYRPTPYRPIPFYRLDEDIVWGATGRLLTELLGAVLARRSGVAP